MRKFLTLALVILAWKADAQRDYTKLVNPFIGTGGHGHTYPGASMPFGMMQLSPDTRMADWDGSSGYHYSDSVIYGFSHTHLSGTGIPDLCDVLFMPFSGQVQWKKEDYRSAFSHRNEKAIPGYYEVLLDKHRIKAQLSTSLRAGIHQYTFPAGTKEGSLLIDLKHRDEVLDSYIEQVSPTELKGMRRSRSWAQDQVLYFYIRLPRPLKNMVVLDTNGQEQVAKSISGRGIKAALRIALDPQSRMQVRIGISAVSEAGARANLDAEIPDWNFDGVRAKAQQAWNKELSTIDVQGGTKDEQTIFYTALYHCFLVPNLFQDVDGQYRGTDGKVHQAEGFTNYSVFSLWDTYRAYHPLMNLIRQKRSTDWINTFLHQYKNGGMLPVWELHGNETFCMIGYHSVPVITDAYQKGIRGFDAKLALEAMRSYAESDRFGLKAYRELGYIPNDMEHESVSKTLEYAYDDWCIAEMARMLGDTKTEGVYRMRAQNYRNVFDPSTGHMRGKVGVMWYAPFDPREINNFFTEGNSWQYSFAVQHDIEGLMQLHGGQEAFYKKLEDLFTTSSQTTGRDQADVTGLIGQYAQGNEPSHHMAYLFNKAGRPWRTQELLQQICRDFYRNDPDGLIGNEDCGQMSAWYVFTAMGLYPVTPGKGEYELGIPVFDAVRIRLENGRTLAIRTKGRSKGINYVQGVRVDRVALNRSGTTIGHDHLVRAQLIEFELDTAYGVKPSAMMARTGQSENDFVAVPYLANSSNKFKDSLLVDLRSIDAGSRLYYFPQGGEAGQAQPYEQPFTIRNTTQLQFFATRGGKRSPVVGQQFFRIPGDRTIQVLSKVHPMYTAGGNEVLVDSIQGTANWRSGNWQSYFDQDFEAVIDLGTVRPIHYAGVHVLQDVSPWILYPKEVIVSLSNDGVHFTDAGSSRNRVSSANGPAQVQELGISLTGSARYIRVKAINGGKLPAWHESAGNPSHLFIDEVIVR